MHALDTSRVRLEVHVIIAAVTLMIGTRVWHALLRRGQSLLGSLPKGVLGMQV